jgi:hypothetical protein
VEGGRGGKNLTEKQREEGLEETGREAGSSSHHHKAEAVVMSLEIKGIEKREEGRGDTGERREREDDATGDEEREGEEERKFLRGMLDRERLSFKQRERLKTVKVSLAIVIIIIHVYMYMCIHIHVQCHVP